jgi:hypothetical protein
LIAHDPGLLDRGVDPAPLHPLHPKADAPVVDEDHVANRHVFGQPFVLYWDDVVLRPTGRALDERNLAARRDDVGAAGKRAGTDLGTAEVLERGNRLLALFGRCAKGRQPARVVIHVAMGEVQPRDVHARQDELLE